MDRRNVGLLVVMVFMAILISMSAFAQTTGKIEGKVVDADTIKALVGANVVVQESEPSAAVDRDGRYSMAEESTRVENPRILFVPGDDAYHSYDLQQAAEKVSHLIDVSLYSGQPWGTVRHRKRKEYLPSVPQGEDFSKYDLVFVSGMPPSVAFTLKQVVEEAKKRTIVIVPTSQYVGEGNVDLSRHPWIRQYYDNGCEENYRRLMIYLGVKFCGVKAKVKEPIIISERAIYHPDAKKVFENLEDYLKWYTYNPQKLSIGILFSRHYYRKKLLGTVNALIRDVEKKGCNVVAMYGVQNYSLNKFFVKDGKPIVDCVITFAVSLNMLNEKQGIEEARAINVPFL